MSADCIQDILAGTAQRQCPYNGDGGVHRGFIPDLHADYTAEGWFRSPYSLETVDVSMTGIHQHAQHNGVFMNYVGPGPHKIVIVRRDSKGRVVLVKAKHLKKLDGWQADGVQGAVVEDRNGDQFYVTGSVHDQSHLGLVYIVDIIDGAERWLLTANGTGVTPLQRLRVHLGTIEWMNWIDTLENGLCQQMEVQGSAESALGNRPLATAYWRRSAAMNNNRSNDIVFRQALDAEVAGLRQAIPWMQPAVLI